MSSGGFYKFRCKNFYTYNCNNWVYVNNSVCATCCAEGRDDEMVPLADARPLSRDVFVPRAEDGMLYYTAMELVAGVGGRPARLEPAERGQGTVATTTSAIPGAPLSATAF